MSDRQSENTATGRPVGCSAGLGRQKQAKRFFHRCACGAEVTDPTKIVEYRTAGGQVRKLCQDCEDAGLAKISWIPVIRPSGA
jgi:hypothetical protein